MPGLYQRLKSQALRRLPDPVLQRIKMWHYARTLRAFRDEDEPDVRVVRHLVLPGTTAIDLGANIGVYTRVLSELVSPTGAVVSVEPMPETHAILAANVRALSLSNVTTVHAAVSDHAGILHMAPGAYVGGGSNYYEAHVVAEGGTPVQARTLDEIVGARTRVGFVKCDVEGHELAVLAGATELLDRQRPAWLVEVSTAGVIALFERNGYGTYWYDGVTLRRRAEGDRSVNYFFLTDAHVARLRAAVPSLMP